MSTRLLLTYDCTEMLKAVLPPAAMAHPRAPHTLCEGLSLWLQQPLSVALYADAWGCSPALGLCDGLGSGRSTLHYDVEFMDMRRRRRLGSFRDLRQLAWRDAR